MFCKTINGDDHVGQTIATGHLMMKPLYPSATKPTLAASESPHATVMVAGH